MPYIGSGDENYNDTTGINFPPPTVIFSPEGTEYIPFLTEDDSFQINLFENNDDLIPAYVQLIDGLGGNPTAIWFTRPTSINLDGTISYGSLLWEDLEGKVTLTMLSGSMALESLYVEVFVGGHRLGGNLLRSLPSPLLFQALPG